MSNIQPWDYFPLIPVYAFTSKKKARRFVKEKTGLEYTVTGKNGQCTWYDNGKVGFCVVRLDCKNKSQAQKYGILAHECVHYAQYFAEHIDGKLDSETEAYVVQSAMLACIDQIGEEWFK